VNRQEKQSTVERLNGIFAATPHVILASFRGLSVNQETELRGRIRDIGGTYAVVKNRLAKLAATGTPMEPLAERLSGPCALATHASDPVVLAKTINAFAKDNPQLELVAGVVDARDLLDVAQVKVLAALPGLDELRGQLLALFQTPATTLVRLLSTPGTQLARVLDARRESQEGAS